MREVQKVYHKDNPVSLQLFIKFQLCQNSNALIKTSLLELYIL